MPRGTRHYKQTSRPHPYKSVGFNIGRARKYHNREVHLPKSLVMDTQSTQGDGSGDKKRKLHEAQIIPNLGPLQWGFPNTIITKIRYGELISMSPTAVAPLKQYLFRANSCFDPDFTGGGHQPMYYDSYTTIYDQYVVIGSKITCTFMTNASQSLIVGIVTDDDSSVSSVLSILLEQNNSVSAVMGDNWHDNVQLFATYEPQALIGVDAKSDGASQTSVGANPTEEIYFCLFATPEDQVSAVSCRVKVEIEYTVKFSELKTPSSS